MTDDEPIETIADLEIYGLSIRSIELLNRMDCLYIADLGRITDSDFLSHPGVGPIAVRELRAALENLRNGRPIKTVRDCLHF